MKIAERIMSLSQPVLTTRTVINRLPKLPTPHHKKNNIIIHITHSSLLKENMLENKLTFIVVLMTVCSASSDTASAGVAQKNANTNEIRHYSWLH